MNPTTKIVLLTLIILNFFGLLTMRYVSYAIHLAFIINFIAISWINREVPKSISFPFSLILIGFTFSIISSMIFENGNPWKIFTGGRFLLSIYYLFFIKYLHPERRDIERALVVLSLLMCSFYILQFVCMQYGIYLLPKYQDLDDEVETDLRMRMNGSALSAFGYFYGLSKMWNKEGKRLINFTLIILGGTVIILMAFRTLIAALAIVTAILAVKNSTKKGSLLRKIFVGALILFLVSRVPIVQEKFEYMIEKQIGGKATFANKEYIRLRNLQYHYNGYFQDDLELFFGSGIAAAEGTPYADKLEYTRSLHFRWVDWGLLGLSWMVGIITVTGILCYVWRALRIKYESSDSYIFAFFLYLILSSITTNEFARPGNFAVQALVLYLAYDIYYKQTYDRTR